MSVNGTSDLGNDSFSCYHPSVVGYRYFGVLWGSLVVVVGTVGNVLTVLAFATDRRLQTRFNVLIVNLAVADTLYCAVLQPTSVDSYLHLHWRGGASWCRIFGLLLFLSNAVSILTLCLIAAGRYLLIARRPVFERVFSRRGLALLLPATWGLALASFGPLWPVYVFAPQVCTCSFHRTRGRPYTTILLFFYFFFSLGCVGLFYFFIYRKVRVAAHALDKYRLSRRSSRKRAPPEADSGVESGSATHSTEISGHGPGKAETQSADASGTPRHCPDKPGSQLPGTAASTPTAHQSQEAPSRKSGVPTYVASTPTPAPAPASAPNPAASSPGEDGEFKRVTRMCFTVFLCFVFSFAPFLLLNILDARSRAPQALHMFCANLTWLNSCINPVLYAAMNRQFNQAYRALLGAALRPLACLWRPRH
ncbi:G-protein coupled receptor 84 [Lepisosteus oculatus]|uniref:G-protein coupled receptor 84 n=1 Tax=Lepisosteus oculatus TaxID=7918 RepID=UPI0003EA9499|nr:PREDICTED: G-protein coupled receptor 84 [Lepisosteus oculatus]